MKFEHFVILPFGNSTILSFYHLVIRPLCTSKVFYTQHYMLHLWIGVRKSKIPSLPLLSTYFYLYMQTGHSIAMKQA